MTKKYILSLSFAVSSLFAFSQSPTPILNSRPTVTSDVIYLDFNGRNVSGTSWNTANNITTINALPSALSTANKILVWQRVSEDYIPFNVNVTTDSTRFNAAPANHRIRVLITPTYTWYGNGAGGVAYVNSYSWGGYPGTPCWVFETQVSSTAKNVAEAASHEAGHTLSLRHHGVWNSTCSLTAGYNSGVGTGVTSWAPIMGVGYSKNVTIWHAGPNSQASSSSPPCGVMQYDHGTGALGITGTYNGTVPRLSFVTDDVGNTYSTAKTLNLNSLNLLDSGLISTPSDIDAYKFTICNNRYVSFNIKPWALDTSNTYVSPSGSNLGSGYQGANLDIRFHLYNAATNSLIAVDTTLTRLYALRGVNLTPGTYYFTIDGGRSSNYSDYGSLGRYYIRIKATNPPALSNSIVTSSNICTGQSTMLTYTSNAALSSWQWTISGAAGTNSYSSVSNPNVVFNTAGMYTISLLGNSTTSAGCIVTKTLNVLPSPNLNATPSNTICANEIVTVTASGASTYTWQPGNLIGASQVFNPAANTIYTVVGTTGSCSSEMNVSIVVNPLPSSLTVLANKSAICEGESVMLIAGGSGIVSYTWSTGETSVTIVVSPTLTTTYTVTGVNANGCARSTTVTANVDACLGIENIDTKNSELKIYPNPTHNFVTIESYINSKIEIFDELGSLVFSRQLGNDSSLLLNTENWAKGIYFVKAISPDKKQTVQKLVIE